MITDDIQQPPIEIEQIESLKIIKNTKGWNYEYKLLGTIEEQILRIDNIENALQSKFNKEVK
jgi:hypothetical protein